MRLLLDLGNTRLKWALHDGGDWLARGAAVWSGDVATELARAWRSGVPQPTEALGASVVDAEREARAAAAVRAAFGREVAWLRTPAQACGVRSAYAEPGRLGVDRFLAMVAAYADGHAPCVLAGIGTALTLDALAADGRHLGGLIAPGPLLMQQSVLGATAGVRPQGPGAVVDVADNTADALVSGCWQAAAALIERFADRMAPRLGGTPGLRLGGGDAETLRSLLSRPAVVVGDGVLHGLAVWAASAPMTPPSR